MDKATFVKGMFILGEAYEKELGDNLLEVYYQFLNHLTPDQLERAARRHIVRSAFFPKVSELLQAVREDFPSAIEIWNQLMAGAQADEKPTLSPAAEKAMAFIGGWEAICYTNVDELKFRFKDFERAYLEAQAREQEQLSVSPRPQIEGG